MTLTIRIKQHAFTFPTRFEAGHRLSAGEAQALNQLFAENVRNNMSPKVHQALRQSETGILSTEVHRGLSQAIREYALAYEFVHRPEANGGGRQSALEAEIIAVARESAGDDDEKLVELLTDSRVHDEARRRLAVRQQVAKDALRELMSGTGA